MALRIGHHACRGGRFPHGRRSSLEVTRSYANFSLPPLDALERGQTGLEPTLVDQSAGQAVLVPATDAEPANSAWRPVAPYMEEVVELYRAGYSLTAIEKKVGIAWDSVARLLDKAGVRERKNKSR